MKIVKSSCSGKKQVRTCTFSPQVNIKNKRECIQTQEDINAAYSEAKIQDLVEDLKNVIWMKVSNVATSDSFGFDEDEVNDYFFVDVTPTEIGEDHDEAVRVEVRAEVSYDGLEKLMDALNPIIESYDSYAYFEPVEPGIIEAYVSVNQVDMSIYGATASPDHMFYEYHGKRFSVHDNSSQIRDDVIEDVYYLWKGNVSQQAGAYNDADEDYVYAFIRGQGVVEYYKKGKYVATSNYNLRDEDDFEWAWEYMEIILQDVCDRLIEYNKDVPDRMVYNSTYVEASDSYNLDDETYEYVTNIDGYWVYRAVIDGKGVWRAMPQGSNESQFEELSFPISYAQARGFEPINEPTAITKLRKDLGKKLLSKSGRSVEATTEYLDIGGILGKPNARYSSEDLRSIYEEEKHHDPLISIYEKGKHHDPLISQYDSYESWFKDIEQYLYEIYSDTEDITSSTDDKVFIEDILDGLEDNGYDLSRIRSIRRGLLELFGYKGKDADIIIHDMVAGGFIDPNDWVDKDYTPGIYSATDDGEGYWFFTTHGVQPGSVPRDVDILDIIDTPNGSFVKFDRFLSTKELNEYDMVEKAPKSVMSSKESDVMLGDTVGIYPESDESDESDELRSEDDHWVQEIEWAMSDLPSWFKVKGDNLHYKVTYNNQTVDVEFSVYDIAKYTYYINGDGPYTTNQAERIGEDIENYIDGTEDVLSETQYDEDLPMVDQEYDSAATSTVLDMNPEFRNNFEEAVDFFYEDYPATVELTDEVDEDYGTLYKAYVKETGSLYQQTPGIVYIDINWDSGEILQALQETAEAIGIEQYPDNIESSESVEGDTFSQLEDAYLSPPEYDDPIEHEDSEELVEVELNQIITVDVDGDYEWDDDTYVWASPDGSNEEWRSEDGVFIDDKVGVVEHIDDLIIPNVPVRPGKYKVTGLAELVYDVSGIQEYRTNYGPDDYESDLDIDHAVVSFNFRKSEVRNLKITPVRR